MLQPHPGTPIVQKFGGSSLSTTDKIRAVARKVVETRRQGRPVVVVVSAMGDTTSQLVDRARAVSSSPQRRELDVLLSSGERMSMALMAMAIDALGQPAISLTGPQSGIVTDGRHTDAEILDVRPDRVSRELAQGNVVIVAGYQGLSTGGEITTLGRGGSDTTAVAIASALRAERCEIYSDVPGVYTADPRLVDAPRQHEVVPADLMAEYALHGARVLHPACIELAADGGVPIVARSTFGEGPGTRIDARAADGEPEIVGVASRRWRMRLDEVAVTPAELDAALRRAGVVSGVLHARRECLLDLEDLADAERVVSALHDDLGQRARFTEDLASISIVAEPGTAARIAPLVEGSLAEGGARVVSTYRRPTSITCAIDGDDRRSAVRALHERFVEEAPSLAVGR